MIILKFPKKLLAVALASGILITSLAPSFAVETSVNSETRLEQSDSTKSKDDNYKKVEITEQQASTTETSSQTNLAYNIIYYLISIFIKTNPLSRPS